MFSFIRYISPNWYYNLKSQNYRRYWADFNLLEEVDKALIEKPIGYTSSQTALLDMSYQAWLKGIIGEEESGFETKDIRPDIRDEYLFLRRHFNPVWGGFVLFVRLIELNNPFKEIKAHTSSCK